MTHNPPFLDIDPPSVDWQTPQSQFFAVAPAPTVIARRLNKSTRQVERWRDCATPLPLYEGFRVADVVGDFRLIQVFAHDVNRLLVKKPSRPRREGGTNMETYMELAGEVQRLGVLALKDERGEPLTVAEREEQQRLCRAIQGLAAMLEELGKFAEQQRR